MPGTVELHQWLPIVFTILSAGSSLVVHGMDHPKDTYRVAVTEIQDDIWNDVCGELGPIVADVYEFVEEDSNDHTQENLSRGAKASMVLRRVLEDRDDLNGLEEKLEELDEPKRTYKRCRQSRTRAILLLAGAMIGYGIVSSMLFVVNQTSTVTLVETAIFTVSSGALIGAAWMALRYFNTLKGLDKMTEDHDFM